MGWKSGRYCVGMHSLFATECLFLYNAGRIYYVFIYIRRILYGMFHSSFSSGSRIKYRKPVARAQENF